MRIMFTGLILTNVMDWGCDSVSEHLPYMCAVLSLIVGTAPKHSKILN